jgi:hypothetical protein
MNMFCYSIPEEISVRKPGALTTCVFNVVWINLFLFFYKPTGNDQYGNDIQPKSERGFVMNTNLSFYIKAFS